MFSQYLLIIIIDKVFTFFLKLFNEYDYSFQLLTQEDRKIILTFINDFEQMFDCVFFTNLYIHTNTVTNQTIELTDRRKKSLLMNRDHLLSKSIVY